MQDRPAPSEQGIADMVHGRAQLPWWSDSAAGGDGATADELLVATFYSRYFEWRAAVQEIGIVTREFLDIGRCCVEHLRYVQEALQLLPASPATFTQEEGHVAYLSAKSAALVDLHNRTAVVAAKFGILLDPIPADLFPPAVPGAHPSMPDSLAPNEEPPEDQDLYSSGTDTDSGDESE